MIFPKKTLIAVALVISTIIITVVLIYLARTAIVKNFIEERLALYHVKITCLDFQLSTDLTLAVSHLCLQTPHADISIEDMAIEFTLSTEPEVKRIDIASVTIEGTAELFTLLKTSRQKSNATTLTQQLDTYLTQLEQLNMPFNINVAELDYSPFALKANKKANSSVLTKATSYKGKFSAVENTIDIVLKDPQLTTFLAAKFSKSNNRKSPLTIKLSGQLKPLKHFIFQHKLPLSPKTLDTLATIEASGEFNNLMNYQAGQLTLNSQLQDFSLAAAQGIAASGPFTLTGALNLHSQVNLALDTRVIHNGAEVGGELKVEFQQDNTLQLQYSHQHLADYLSKNTASPELISLLKANPAEQLTVTPYGKLTYNLNNHQLSLSSVALKVKNDQQVQQLSLDNIILDLNYYLASEPTLKHIDNIESKQFSEKNLVRAKEKPSLAQLDFTLESTLLVPVINKFTHSPLVLKLQGSMKQNQAQTTIKINKNSSVISNNITVWTKQQTADKKLVSIKQLETQIQGTAQIQNLMQTKINQHRQNTPNINLNFNINSQAKKFRAANIIDIKTLAIITGVTGNLSDIKIQATATADNVPLGNIAISGAIDKPNIALTAKKLPLTELLSLNIKSPQKVALVAGELSYSVTGQVTDLKNIQNTPLALSVAITSLSGDIADIWIQELNWQQNFQFLAGEFSTLNDPSENSKENLTVALIDTPTPISKLSISTDWHYQKNFKISATKLKGDILGGSFAIPKIQWPLAHGHSVDVQLTSIDLEQVLALDKKQGIVVTGKISGQLPINYDGEKYTMEKGELHNVSNGLIQVIDNPSVQELKASNTQLQLAFDALQNLHYHQLSSDVSMADDGYMLLETVIKGRNPDIDNDVNLNLNLSYDLLGLLKSMSITERFEERIIKGLQKN